MKNWYLEMTIWNIIFCKALFEALFDTSSWVFIILHLGARFSQLRLVILWAELTELLSNMLVSRKSNYCKFNPFIQHNFCWSFLEFLASKTFSGSSSFLAGMKAEILPVSPLLFTNVASPYEAPKRFFFFFFFQQETRNDALTSFILWVIVSLHRANHSYIMLCP